MFIYNDDTYYDNRKYYDNDCGILFIDLDKDSINYDIPEYMDISIDTTIVDKTKEYYNLKSKKQNRIKVFMLKFLYYIMYIIKMAIHSV